MLPFDFLVVDLCFRVIEERETREKLKKEKAEREAKEKKEVSSPSVLGICVCD